MIDKSPYRKKLAKLFASLALIASCFITLLINILVSNTAVDVDLIALMLKRALAPAFVLGYLGFLIGRILDNKSVRDKADKSSLSFTRDDIKEAYAIDSIFSVAGQDNSQLNSMFAGPQIDAEASSLGSMFSAPEQMEDNSKLNTMFVDPRQSEEKLEDTLNEI